MDAGSWPGCGSSTLGHRDGPVICNESQGMSGGARSSIMIKKVPCEFDAAPCLGHAPVCSACSVTIMIPIGSSGSASAR